MERACRISSSASALGGATAAVFGAMLLVGAVDAVDLGSGATTERLDDDWWWYALYVALAVAAVIVQLRYAASVRASLRAEWSAAGGRHLRPTGAA